MSGITSIAVKLHINEITPSDLFLLIVPVFNTLLRSCDRTQNKFLNHTSNTIFSHFLGKKIKIKIKRQIILRQNYAGCKRNVIPGKEVFIFWFRRDRILDLTLHTLEMSLLLLYRYDAAKFPLNSCCKHTIKALS